jgi:hypothetical protein
MTQDEWLDRYAKRFIARCGVTPDQAAEIAKAETFAVLSEGFEDDPEDAADSEMSYWDVD